MTKNTALTVIDIGTTFFKCGSVAPVGTALKSTPLYGSAKSAAFGCKKTGSHDSSTTGLINEFLLKSKRQFAVQENMRVPQTTENHTITLKCSEKSEVITGGDFLVEEKEKNRG